MTEDPRDPLIRSAIDAFNTLDVDGLMGFIHPKVVSRVSETMGNPGSYEGVEGFGTMMADWSEAWSDQRITLREVEHVTESTSLVYVDQSLVGAGSGVPVEAETTFLIVFEDERAIQFEIHPTRESALEAL